MGKDLRHLPFKVGQQAESKCFLEGFRSAWFRCKIKNISIRRGQIGLSLEFFDFPDEKVTWTQLYQKPPESHGKSALELMVRPSFPPFYQESQLPNCDPSSDVIAIVDDDRKVGDLVDWWCDNCFWSARVTQLLGKDKMQIELPNPPIGEGKSYEALWKDLRPSLDWSLEHGWTVPISREYGNSQGTRLVQPLKQVYHAHVDDEEGNHTNMEGTTVYHGHLDDEEGNHTNMERTAVYHGHLDDEGSHTNMKRPAETNDMTIVLKSDCMRGEHDCLYDESSSHDKLEDSSGICKKMPARIDRYRPLNVQKRTHSNETRYMTSIGCSDTVESAIMELEELAIKVRWLKGLVQFGFRWSNAMKPSWTVLENHGPHK